MTSPARYTVSSRYTDREKIEQKLQGFFPYANIEAFHIRVSIGETPSSLHVLHPVLRDFQGGMADSSATERQRHLEVQYASRAE